MVADWLKESKQEDDSIIVIMSVLRSTAWESDSDVMNKLAAEHPGKEQMSDYKSFLLNLYQ